MISKNEETSNQNNDVVVRVPKTMKELFKNWHGKYEASESLSDWNDIEPTGEEIW